MGMKRRRPPVRVDRCPTCNAPCHASEGDDYGTCGKCRGKIANLTCPWLEIDPGLLAALGKIPPDETDGGDAWWLAGRRFVRASRYPDRWLICSEGTRHDSHTSGYTGSCMRKSTVVSIIKNVISAHRAKMLASTDPVTPFHEEGARVLVFNALVSARNSGYAIRCHRCHRCSDDVTTPTTMCMPCAVSRYRDLDRALSIESEMARIFDVPHEWVVALIGGFDGDKDETIYKGARSIGRALWRKFKR